MAFEVVGGILVDPAAPRMAAQWRMTGTHTGRYDPPGLEPTGKPLSFEGIDVCELRDGKICYLRGIYDVAETMEQLGVLPKTGTRRARMMDADADQLGIRPRRR
jgi:predicted ester cyclase